MVPAPGPYSTMVRARDQSTWCNRRLTRKRELGMTEPSIRGCLRKLRLKSRRELTDSFRLATRARTAAAQRRKIQGFGSEDKCLAEAPDRHVGVRLPPLAEGGLLPCRSARAPGARLVCGT